MHVCLILPQDQPADREGAQHTQLALNLGRALHAADQPGSVGEQVAGIGVLRHLAQRHPLATAANHEGRRRVLEWRRRDPRIGRLVVLPLKGKRSPSVT